MTTASRPTFDPARGGKSKFESDMTALTKHYSSRDLPGHTTMKYREPPAQTNASLKRDLESRERGTKPQSGASLDRIASSSSSQASSAKRTRTDLLAAPSSANPDADDPTVVDDDNEDEQPRRARASDSEDDDEEDETALLLAELERIKKEREVESVRRETERQTEEERAREEALVRGNPLLNGPLVGASSFTVKKRWDDDTVFKNCARGLEDSAAKRKRVGYVNDTLRSEFHKRFMDKFIK